MTDLHTDSLSFADASFDASGPANDRDDHVAATTPTSPAPQVDAFAAFGLSAPLLAAVRDLGYTAPTPVQVKTIPLAMTPKVNGSPYNDLMVSSQTGSGKTAAYLLPLLHTLFVDQQQRERDAQAERERMVARGEKPPKRQFPMHPRHFKAATPGALVLCPTRELAQQVAHDAIELVRHIRGVRIATVIGGLPYQQQIARLQDAALVVATPGRLLDLQRSSQIKCEAVKFLVVDEADRMLDLGFADALAEINQLTIERQQTMMFSATFEARIQGLARRVMRDPQRVTIDTPQERHANIEQSLYWADNAQHKRKLLDALMRNPDIGQAIVFASTQIECDGLAADLFDAGFVATALHGALSQMVRNRRLGLLREGRIQFLVATDVAARGLDVPSISHVFNYGLPMKTEDYVHRIGRTGRAGRQGTAITIAEHRDRRKIGDIEHYTQQRLQTAVVPGLEPTAPKREAPTRKQREQQRTARRGPSGGHGGGGYRDGGHTGYREGGGFSGGHAAYEQHAPEQRPFAAPRAPHAPAGHAARSPQTPFTARAPHAAGHVPHAPQGHHAPQAHHVPPALRHANTHAPRPGVKARASGSGGTPGAKGAHGTHGAGERWNGPKKSAD